ncbi:hypothetical protein GQ53DRAFT_856838 [Thozetella sp. PMI_491]|nr:hypothetical protein GQ53DRAFT_856838 [Thozetella sp. PMI_491]
MKAAIFSLFALVASAIATPLVSERQTDAQEATIEKLSATVQGYTANINKTINALSDNPSLAEQSAAVAAIAPSLQGITDALNGANTAVSKRDSYTTQAKGLLAVVTLLVWEIVGTVKLLLKKIGLGLVLVHLTPLLVSLAGLVKSLDRVVGGLLIAVKVIVDSLLGAVAAGLLKLF